MQVISKTDDWAEILVTGDHGGACYSGFVQTKYLVSDGSGTEHGCIRIRLIRGIEKTALRAAPRSALIDMSGLAAGTELTVIGTSDKGVLICLTDGGKLCSFRDDGSIEVLESSGTEVKTGSRVKMRVVPDKSADTILTVPKGKKVAVLLRGNEWTIVRYNGQTGYIMSQYLIFP